MFFSQNQFCSSKLRKLFLTFPEPSRTKTIEYIKFSLRLSVDTGNDGGPDIEKELEVGPGISVRIVYSRLKVKLQNFHNANGRRGFLLFLSLRRA